MTEASSKQIAAMLNARIGDVARSLLGEPNHNLSCSTQLRFGTHGSIAVELSGDDAGCWFDHERGVGGDGLEMVKSVRHLTTGPALDWSRTWLGLPARVTRKRRPAPPASPAASAASEVIAESDACPPPPPPPCAIDLNADASGDADTTGNIGNTAAEALDLTELPTDALTLRAARSAKKIAEDAKRAARVAEFVSDSEDPHGTRVDLYLRRRGITATPLPPSIRYLPNAYNHYGALVALSTDAQGQVHGLQLIYLTEDGRKAPLKVQKRTNKAHDNWTDVAAVRMPGNPPLVLCEGVETGLSIWQATGQETWACLGISNIARAPVPDGAPIVIARDSDAPDSKADQQLIQAVTILRQQGRDVTVAEPPAGMDFNDVLQSDGDETVRMLIATTRPAAAFSDEWREELLLNEDKEPRPVLANAITALRSAPQWDGVLWHDAFATATVARKPPPWIQNPPTPWPDTAWSDRDDALVADWLQHQEIMVPMSVAGQAVEVVSRDRQFHPVREFLDGLAWDGTPRLETWLLTYLGAEDTPYHRAVGARWLISAVARIYVPGCKADCALILEGPQGIRKSSALMALAQPWFTDRLSDLGSKDAAMETRGVWIIEIAELDTMGRAEVSTIKAFMSRTQDRFRPPYGKRLVDLARQCVFAGSVNPEGGYLKDPTGGRRFWPVVCGTIDIATLERDRDQLWAEARDRFRRNEPWWLETQDLDALATEEQAERYQGDAWDEPIEAYLENETRWLENGYGERNAYRQPRATPLNDVSVAEIMEHALDIEKGRWTQIDQNRVVRSLVSMGFKKCRPRKGGHGKGGQRERRYRRDPVPGAGQ